MGPSIKTCLTVAAFLLGSLGSRTWAQQTTIGMRNNTVSDGFYEHIGTSWGVSGGGFRAYFGNPLISQPSTGGYQPESNPTLSYNFHGPSLSGYFNLYASQGSTRGLTGQSPTITLMNGQQGFVADTLQSPFVISVVPVVGGYGSPAETPLASTSVQLPAFSTFNAGTTVSVPSGGSALMGGINRADELRREFGAPGLPANRSIGGTRSASNVRAAAQVHDMAKMDRQILNGSSGETSSAASSLTPADTSSATRGAPSVADAHRLHAAEQTSVHDEVAQWFERAQAAEAEGKMGAAKVYYQLVVRKASGDLKNLAADRLQSLRSLKSSATSPGSDPQ